MGYDEIEVDYRHSRDGGSARKKQPVLDGLFKESSERTSVLKYLTASVTHILESSVATKSTNNQTSASLLRERRIDELAERLAGLTQKYLMSNVFVCPMH
eukprot:IDg20119t1